MIPHVKFQTLADALRVSGTALDAIAMDKIQEGQEMHRDYVSSMATRVSLKDTTLMECRIYMAHSIFNLEEGQLKRQNEEYVYLAKHLDPVATSSAIAVPRLIDPVDIETGKSEMMDTRPEELVASDLKMIDSCDYFVYDFRRTKPSAGACMELFYASTVRKMPTIVIVPEGMFKHDLSPWIQAHASYLAWSMDSAAEIINQKMKQAFSFAGQSTTLRSDDFPQRNY
ncbi:hypothetical protein KFS98_003737 [Salmonella enterica]|nr:hypothetical protein [Salmonella enterica]